MTENETVIETEVDNDAEGKAATTLRKRILRNRRLMAKAQLDMIADINTMRSTMSEGDLRSFLLVECGVPQSDIKAILSFEEVLGKDAGLLREHATPFAVIKAMINSDTVTREASLKSIAAGDNVDVRTIAFLKRMALRSKIGNYAYSERSRQRALKAAANAKTASLVKTLAESSEALLMQIARLVRSYEPDEITFHVRRVVEDDEYLADAVAIRENAKMVLRQFHALYGEIEVPEGGFASMNAGHRQQLAAAEFALTRFSKGLFGYGPNQNGFGFELGFIYKSELQEALRYLLPCMTQAEPESLEPPTDRERLRFVEICAGAGGQAIGLMQAGFEPVALYDKDANATNTLNKNWNWNVRKAAIQDVTDTELRQYYDIDLLAGGVECRAFSVAGKQKGQKDRRNLFDEAIRYVDIIRPRAFFFENVDGFRNEKFTHYRASVFRRLRALGYQIGLHVMHGENFGLAQARKRVVLVGIRHDQQGVFSMPASDSRKIGIADVVGDMLFPHQGKGDTSYDEWSSRWLETYGREPSYTVVSSLFKAKPEIIERWKLEGGFEIDIEKLDKEPLTPAEILSPTQLPYLSVAVAKALQGFPDAWEFDGAPHEQFYQIGNAFPPQMSCAVGIAISHALETRLPNSVLPPPLVPFDETLIGVKPKTAQSSLPKLNGMTRDWLEELAHHNGKTVEDMRRAIDEELDTQSVDA